MRRIIAGFVCSLFALALTAGDGFGGALSHGLLEGWSLERCLRLPPPAACWPGSSATC